jgi:hypothetical protein
MARMSDQAGLAITNTEPGKRGTRAYFDVDDINGGAQRVRELGGEADQPGPVRAWAGSSRAGIRKGTSSASGKTTRPPRRQRVDLAA